MYNFLVSLLKKTIHIYIVLYINKAFSFFVYGALKNMSNVDCFSLFFMIFRKWLMA